MSVNDNSGAHLLIVEAVFYQDIADELAKGAITALEAAGATFDRVSVPGALEIPATISLADLTGEYDGYVALGCVIRGETSHYDIVCEQSAAGIMSLTIQDQLAIGNGILTVENRDQAMARAKSDQKNKGGAVAEAALRMVELQREFGMRMQLQAIAEESLGDGDLRDLQELDG